MTLIISPLEKLLAEHSEKQPVYLMIYRNAQRILRLINQLMDIRKLGQRTNASEIPGNRYRRIYQ